jgi:hypothetical protein
MERVKHPQKLGDRLGAPDTHDLSFVVLFEGWIEDLQRFYASAQAHLGSHDWELVVVDNPVDDEASERIASMERVMHIPLREPVGYGAGRNLGLRLSTGRVVCVIDTSVEMTGDVATPLYSSLADPSVGLVGRWGVSTDHGFHFEESGGPDVDGVEAYLMALRRADLQKTGLFHAKFKWYRNADLDFSFQVRAAGLRTIVDDSLPVERHVHRLWEATPEPQREELSRKNFFRFRDHWAERPDLFVAPDAG